MFLQQLVSGLAIGSIYALIGIGFTLIWKTINLVNFAQGEMVMMGAFFAYTCHNVFHMPLWGSLTIAVLASGGLGIAVERLALRPLANAPEMSLLLVTIALSMLFQNLAQLIWGADALSYPGLFSQTNVIVGGVSISTQYLAIMAISLVSIVVFHLFFQYTKIGKGMRAAAQDHEIASVFGVKVRSMHMLAFGVSGIMGGLAGVLVAPVYLITPTMGALTGLKAFAAAVIGGFDNTYGALAGGLLIGVLETLAAGYVSSAYADVISFVALLLVLRFRPSGILGRSKVEKV